MIHHSMEKYCYIIKEKDIKIIIYCVFLFNNFEKNISVVFSFEVFFLRFAHIFFHPFIFTSVFQVIFEEKSTESQE